MIGGYSADMLKDIFVEKGKHSMTIVSFQEIMKEESTNVIRFAPFEAKMEAAGLSDMVIRVFHYYYNQLVVGATGFIPSAQARPVQAIPDYEALDERYALAGEAALGRVVMLKLNGGLGTSMGMNGPKSLLKVKEGLSFLDITAQQIRYLRQRWGVGLPLVLMNSFATHEDTLAALAAYDDFAQEIPFGFLQHKVPKVCKETLKPARWPQSSSNEWNPPGHGDLYAAISTSGTLDQLLDAGYEFAFVSNSDNLGAVLDTAILGYFAEERLPFLMEVASRTAADRKGGHLAQQSDGQLILRELAQCPPDELHLFQDINCYQYFNTNNLWIHLPTLRRVLDERDGVLGLPLIRNEKPIDPKRPETPPVYQLETAMGSAIAVFEGAQAMRVPRSRFVPVKKNNDLLLLMSDVYVLNQDFTIQLSPQRHAGPPRRPPLVELDHEHYRFIEDMQLRFPHGAPSLVNCNGLRVEGDIRFGKDVVLLGDVDLSSNGVDPTFIEDGRRIVGK